MPKSVRNDDFSIHTRRVYMPSDPIDLCPVCREYIYWPEEEVSYNKDDQMIHARCVNKKGAEKYGA